MEQVYQASSEEKKLDIVNVFDLEKEAENYIPKGGYDYIRHGAGDEWTLRQNTVAFNHKGLAPHVLSGVENPDTRTSLYGIDLSAPIIVPPIAAQGLVHERAEAATIEGATKFGTLMSISSYSAASFEEIVARHEGVPNIFQLYMSKDNQINKDIIDEAKAHGAKVLVLTADATTNGNREADIRNHFVYPFGMPIVQRYLEGTGAGQSLTKIYATSKQKIDTKDVEFMASYSGLPVVIKGVQLPEDALKAIGAGASGIWVSNHGGRQLDGGPAAFDVLPSIARVVEKKVPIIFDSGVRRGQHIFKALASGADVVGIGRPILYGLALGGAQGVESVLSYFKRELEMVMQLAGAQTVEDIKNTTLVDNIPFA